MTSPPLTRRLLPGFLALALMVPGLGFASSDDPEAQASPEAEAREAGPEIGDVTIKKVVFADPQLKLLVEVHDPRGDPVRDLSMEDIGIEIHETASRLDQVQDFVSSGEPFGTLLLIDTSCSMGPSMPDVKRAARSYVEGMKGGDVAIVAQFNDEVQGQGRAWTRDSKLLQDQIEELQARGNTHFYEALNQSLDAISDNSSAPEFSVLLVLTDGIDEGAVRGTRGSPEHFTLDRVRDQADEHEIRINTVHYVPDATTTKADQKKGREVLEMLSKDSEGRYALARDAGEIEGQFREAQESVHSLWVVTVTSDAMRAGLNPQVKVTVGERQATTALVLDAAWVGEALGGEDAAQDEGIDTRLVLFGVLGLLLLGGATLLVRKNRASQEEQRLATEQQVLEAQRSANRAIESAQEAHSRADQLEIEAQRAAEAAASSPEPEEAVSEQPEPEGTPAAPRRTMFRSPDNASCVLQVVSGGTPGATMDIFQDPGLSVVRIGSDPERVDFFLEHETVSGHHANISKGTGGSVFIQDAGSSNGTYVDGQDIRGRGPISVVPGQQIQFGLLKTVYSA